jgi:hypothetical protein
MKENKVMQEWLHFQKLLKMLKQPISLDNLYRQKRMKGISHKCSHKQTQSPICSPLAFAMDSPVQGPNRLGAPRLPHLLGQRLLADGSGPVRRGNVAQKCPGKVQAIVAEQSVRVWSEAPNLHAVLDTHQLGQREVGTQRGPVVHQDGQVAAEKGGKQAL